MAYCVGNISGCHINPAVSLGVLMSKGMSVKDFIGYVIAQCLGALAGAGLLAAIFGLGGVTDMTGGFGSNGLAGVGGNAVAGLLVELVLPRCCSLSSSHPCISAASSPSPVSPRTRAKFLVHNLKYETFGLLHVHLFYALFYNLADVNRP